MKTLQGAKPTCCVKGCTTPAEYKVMLADDHGYRIHFYEHDSSCRFMCRAHAEENEAESTGLGRSRRYPYTKHGFRRRRTTGWTVYESLATGRVERIADENGFPLD
jgi:hypothetical protein